MRHVILLGSQSSSRQSLLSEAGIAYRVVGHTADESQCSLSGSIASVVSSIALQKMDHVLIPDSYGDTDALILTADTLGIDAKGSFLGKPRDEAQAKEYLRQQRGTIVCATAFCLRMYKKNDCTWQVVREYQEVVTSSLVFDVPEEKIDEYLACTDVLSASGAVCIGGYGAQFVKKIVGSYTAIVGLPLFELRQALNHFTEPV